MLVSLLGFASCAKLGNAADPAPSAEQVEFFEKSVRPLLLKRCVECHGEKKAEGGLRLDQKSAAFKGGDSGPAFQQDQPLASRLFKAVTYSDSALQMPPKGKLPDAEFAVIEAWMNQGIPWPDEQPNRTSTINLLDPAVARQHHWSFKPISQPAVPQVANDSRSQTAIDRFIQARLAEKQLALAPAADRATFIRRSTFDLWGLPPSFEDVNQFVADTSPDAEERLIDRLLASPLYGERWGRHWLDVARYADTKGYVFTEESRYPFAYTYRDYVIRALNSDKPYDRFVMEQLAADQLDLQGESRDLAAMGFLTVGRRYLNNPQDIIDDRIDVVSRGLMGLTIGCCRCHDHKYDPLPTDDYYSLYGVFASLEEPKDLPEIGQPKQREAFEQFKTELKKLEQAIVDYEVVAVQKVRGQLRAALGDVLQQLAFKATPDQNRDLLQFQGKQEPREQLVNRWRDWIDRQAKPDHQVFGVWKKLGKLPPDQFTSQLQAMLEEWKSSPSAASRVNLLLREKLLAQPPENVFALARVYGELAERVSRDWDAAKKENPDLKQFTEPEREVWWILLFAEGGPAGVKLDEARGLFERDINDKLRELRSKVEAWKVTSPGSPPRAMVIHDRPNPHNPHVFIRGNQGRPGKAVPRQFPAIASISAKREPFKKGSGRLELAQSVVSDSNPLTARVIANRVWQQHFGSGIVLTPSDFGVRGETPSHPELLDYLAAQLVRHGWSLKWLHREIMLSAVYRQSGMNTPAVTKAATAIDADNRLLWRMPRKRLEFEAVRDAWLATAGRLNTELEGRPIESPTDPQGNRRSVYLMINRNDLPGVFRTFDYADPDASTATRPQTSIPQQTLFALNSPFVIQQARSAADQARQQANDDPQRTVQRLYQQILSRDPQPPEAALAVQFAQSMNANAELDGKSVEKLSPWERLAQALMLTNEFLFVD